MGVIIGGCVWVGLAGGMVDARAVITAAVNGPRCSTRARFTLSAIALSAARTELSP